MPITLAQLGAFLTVVREGSVTAAADALAVSQPSVSGAVAGLGRELGCELLERSGRGVRLSPAGAAFAPFAQDVVGLLANGRDAALAAAGLAARRLQVVAAPAAAESFIPSLLQAFVAISNPRVEPQLEVVADRQALARVAEHAADLAISPEPVSDPRFVAVPLLDDEFVCISHPDDPLCARRTVAPAELAALPWLLAEPGSGPRALADAFLAAQGLAPRTMNLATDAAIRRSAAAAFGVGLVSRAGARGELDAGVLGEIRLSPRPPRLIWSAVRSSVGPRRPAVDEFIAFAVENLGGDRWR